jgi:mannosyl-oligosaccharide glucosidase
MKLSSNPPEQPFYILNNQLFKESEHNTFFVQITLRQPLIDEKFSFDIIYQSDSLNNQREEDLTGFYFNQEIIRLKKEFDQRFENIFQLKTKQNMTEKQIHFARSTLSNLIGGISYFTGKFLKIFFFLINFSFSGQSLVAKANQKIPDQYWPTSLYTAVPSRSFFPRGFLWDEGFHNLLIARWNSNITIDILSHWFDMLNDNGWIPRVKKKIPE